MCEPFQLFCEAGTADGPSLYSERLTKYSRVTVGSVNYPEIDRPRPPDSGDILSSTIFSDRSLKLAVPCCSGSSKGSFFIAE